MSVRGASRSTPLGERGGEVAEFGESLHEVSGKGAVLRRPPPAVQRRRQQPRRADRQPEAVAAVVVRACRSGVHQVQLLS